MNIGFKLLIKKQFANSAIQQLQPLIIMVQKSHLHKIPSLETTQKQQPKTIEHEWRDRHSEEVHEILTYIPHWIIRWGMMVIFFSVAMLLVMSWIIKYPDVVKGRVTITSSSSPANIVARTGGALKLFVADKTMVEGGEVFAYVKNPARYEHVLTLKSELANFGRKMNSEQAMKNHRFSASLDLGELQGDYNVLVANLKRNKNTVNKSGQNLERKQFIAQQAAEYQSMNNQLERQLSMMEREHQQAVDLYTHRYQPLFRSGAISLVELEKHEKAIFDKLKEVERVKSSVNQNNSQIITLNKQAQELDFEVEVVEVDNSDAIHVAYTKLLSQIAIWEQSYLLKAPIGGQLNYIKFNKDNMYIKSEEEVANVVPTAATQMFGELLVPTYGSGKVNKGQKVLIDLDSYFKKEFGLVVGEVQSVASINTNDAYKVNVSLPNGLLTTAEKELTFKHGMEGNAEIITKDIRLLHRIFHEFRVLLE